jgi:hypothetical protein
MGFDGFIDSIGAAIGVWLLFFVLFGMGSGGDPLFAFFMSLLSTGVLLFVYMKWFRR